jgi:hypothetical protein
VSDVPKRPDLEEPVVRSPALRRYVEAAAQQEYTATPLPWDRLHDAMLREARTRATRRRALLAGVTALAAVVAVALSVPSVRRAVVDSETRGEVTPSIAALDGPGSRGDLPRPAGEPSRGVSMATGADVPSTPHDDHGRTRRPGLVADAARLARDGAAEIASGNLRVAATWSGVVMSSVVAAFSGERDEIVADRRRSTRPMGAAGAEDSADVMAEAERLAVAAELALAQKDRQTAIDLLGQLVRWHSRSPQARAALLDLARLRTAVGDVDGAACVYQRFLDRYPKDAMRSDVRRRLTALERSDIACRGIDPSGQ